MTTSSPIDLTMASPSPSLSASSSSSSSSLFSTATTASSASSSSPSIHPFSLVDASKHSARTLRLVGISITQHLIDYVVDQVIETVDHAMNRPSTLLPASSSSKSTLPPSRPRSAVQQKFSSFATTVITRAELTTPTLLLALVYIHRARPYLHIALEEWALERVFLGALIVASKYANDSTLKNVHWALCTGVFGKRDVGRIEREFLAVLEWDLGVEEKQVLALWEGLEWAVELKEKEEREKEAARIEKERLRQLELIQREQRRQQQKPSSSKFFLYESRQSSEDSLDIPPPLPVKPRNHKRSVPTTHAIILPHTRPQGHSPSSSSVSSSSSSDSLSPTTPEDLHYQYIVIDDGSSPSSASPPPPLPSKKRGFTATTIDLLKSFPFPGHHHERERSSNPKRHEKDMSAPHPYAYTNRSPTHARYASAEGHHGSLRPAKRLTRGVQV